MVKSLRERWIAAMCKVPWSLVGYEGYTEKEARFVCQVFRKSAPKRPDLTKVLALENETSSLPAFITVTQEALQGALDRKAQIEKELAPPAETKIKPEKEVKARAAVGRVEDYLEPWCKVTKNGKVVRYEDANGRPIPKVVARKRHVY